MLSHAMENYLKVIYEILEQEDRATTSLIAGSMGIAAASVTAMVKKLAELRLIRYAPYQGVRLTAAGKKTALEVVRHHRLLEAYLSEALGVPWDRVHDEAEVLEHHISEEFEELIATRLGNPTHDPHGDPIPSADLTIDEGESVALDALEVGARGRFVRVSDADVSAEFRRRSELIRAEYVHIPTAQFEAAIQPTDDEVKARFESNKDRFRLPERRILSYLLVDPVELRTKVLPTGSEIENYYRANTAEFTTPPQVCGRHILVKIKQGAAVTEGHEDSEAKALADAALARLKAGEAFEKVAKEKSEDTSAANGGSLGCFAREQMVPEFSAVAFGLQPGATSDVVKTSFGYHIIKVDTTLPGTTQPLEQARKRIEAQLQDSKSRELASQKAEAVAEGLKSNQTLEQIATAQGLAVKKSEPLQIGKGSGPLTSPVLLSSAFELKAKETSKDGFPAGTGAAFIRLEEILPSKVPDLAEVKDDVKQDLIRFAAREKAREAARALAAEAERTDLGKAATRAKATRVETKGLVGRGQAFTEIPQSSVLEDQVFELPEKKVSGPLDTPSGVAVVRVLEKKSSDETVLAQQRDTIRESLVTAKKDRLFSSYLQTLTDRYPISRNAEALASVR